ncbi:MAG: hypothetical protein L0Z50_42500 [Verrucomicrobiales bacterium]|nr:hypothetical protein [Verrucomicrobiales bacterium]
MTRASLEITSRLSAAGTRAREALLRERCPDGHWEGELSSSALSTATAVTALSLANLQSTKAHPRFRPLVERGLAWLAEHQNTDGGWGDTTRSMSNISTTALAWAAFGAVPGADGRFSSNVAAAAGWLTQKCGGTDRDRLAAAILARYGKDRTFSVPILTMCALAGRLGQGPDAWKHVLPLPFELAALPHRFFAALRLPVVSYALPALIAIGQARHFHRPVANPVTRSLRILSKQRTLAVLEEIQPVNGGFLEATPLTSFVTMSLAGSGQVNHPVTQRGLNFLGASARPDGSWPIDTNLATWVTTLSVNGLGLIGCELLGATACNRIRGWLLAQQFQAEHPYTHAAPGGWAWTNLPGGVPDADDTAGALLALRTLGAVDEPTRTAARAGLDWLLNVQNRDGGIPTFCRGWGALPFDRSGADLTAHTVRAWLAWLSEVPTVQQRRMRRALTHALAYLARSQRSDGAWAPLWFGNQFATDDENLVYGTARVLVALAEAHGAGFLAGDNLSARGAAWLVTAQNADGSWGSNGAGSGTTEETALGLEALADTSAMRGVIGSDLAARLPLSVSRGAAWLLERVENGSWIEPAPIGFYFAKLWYYERLYPLIFTVGALEKLTK